MTGSTPLENKNHETFAQKLAEGFSISESYSQAFPGCARTSAQTAGSRLSNTAKIMARVLFLQTLHDRARGEPQSIDLTAAIRIYETLSQSATLKPGEKLAALNSLVRLRKWDATEQTDPAPNPASICAWLMSSADGKQPHMEQVIKAIIEAYKPTRDELTAMLDRLMPMPTAVAS